MTPATSCRRLRTPGRNAEPVAGRIIGLFAGSFARGFGAIAMGVAVVTGVLAVGGCLLSVALDAREGRRTTIGLQQQNNSAWFAIPRSAVAATVPYVTRNWPDEDEVNAEVTGSAAPQQVALPSSGLLGDVPNDAIFAGPFARQSLRFEQRFSAVTETERFERRAIIPPMILPRTRPQPQKLAALPPSPGLNIPDDDSQLAKTAIYDIAAKAVYLPNGEKLEAHSGFGQYMDDPKYFKLRMRGVTPPNVYRLTMREARFHGVEAIRMNPEDPAAMHGRTGILVHPYMLGPNGQSNGCVSVKDYPRFLAAFKRGEVNRMIVVFRLPQPPAAYAKRHGLKTAKAL